MYTAIHSARLYEQIVKQIEDSILKGALKPGDQLPAERELATKFGVSRTAVREAIKALREKGLVEPFSGRGTFVTTGSAQAKRLDVLMKIGAADNDGSGHLAEMRAILEPEIAALAAVRGDDQDFAALEDAVAVMDHSMNDADAFIEADLDFHLALAEAAANPLILSLIDSIVALLREQRLGIFHVSGGAERGQFHHKRILAAVKSRNVDAARDAMQAHLQQVRDDARAFEKASKSSGATAK